MLPSNKEVTQRTHKQPKPHGFTHRLASVGQPTQDGNSRPRPQGCAMQGHCLTGADTH